MTTDREAFLAGDRPEDVYVFLSGDAVSDPGALADFGEAVEGGIALVMPGDEARGAFQNAVGIDPMAFAKQAMGTEGEVNEDLTGGECPGEGGNHETRFVFAFAEEQNEEVGGLYGEGDVIHAYVSCSCGESYSDKWLAGEK
ncbi:DUF5807 family protein [Halobacteriales archaeon Cl-PHB]